EIRPGTKSKKVLPTRAAFFRSRPDVQTDARHPSIRFVADRFLAAEARGGKRRATVAGLTAMATARARESAVFPPRTRREHRDSGRAAIRRRHVAGRTSPLPASPTPC